MCLGEPLFPAELGSGAASARQPPPPAPTLRVPAAATPGRPVLSWASPCGPRRLPHSGSFSCVGAGKAICEWGRVGTSHQDADSLSQGGMRRGRACPTEDGRTVWPQAVSAEGKNPHCFLRLKSQLCVFVWVPEPPQDSPGLGRNGTKPHKGKGLWKKSGDLV